MKDSWVPCVVDASTAEGRVSDVLLHVGLGPATEVAPVAEGSHSVVVRVPKGYSSEACAGSSTTHDRFPHVVVGVDAWDTAM